MVYQRVSKSFPIFGFEIYYYGVIIAAAILVAFIMGLYLLKKVGYKEDIAYLVVLICVPLGFLFARLYYIIFEGVPFREFFQFRDGGIAIYGGVIGAALGLVIITKVIKRCGFFTVADIGVLCLLLAQVIGRWGNFVNDEAFGLCVNSALVPPFVVAGDSCTACGGAQNHLATFFYESILNLAGFVFLFLMMFSVVFRRGKRKFTFKVSVTHRQKKWGTITAYYLIWYGIVRAIIEPLRMDSLMIGSNESLIINRVSFMLSLALIIVGVLLLWAVKRGWISQENTKCLKTKKTDTAEPK